MHRRAVSDLKRNRRMCEQELQEIQKLIVQVEAELSDSVSLLENS